MKLKISTPTKVIFQWEIEKISLPTEMGNLKVMNWNHPMVTTIQPGIIKIRPMKDHIKVGNEIYVSTTKWMVFVDGKIVRIVTSDATLSPEQSENTLQTNKKYIEDKIKRLKSSWSIEDIERALITLEKINADIELKRMLQIS